MVVVAALAVTGVLQRKEMLAAMEQAQAADLVVSVLVWCAVACGYARTTRQG